ncbi:RHS repeat-associated core domain-containing protein, partial [Tenacibaculum finnmarkense genomovar finnmarkense]|uniref:RHS repeat domain-containing protein n=2 Tax=Tenacibaculum finnmarkense TaxID=2781243 RepID=UPI001EFB7E56
KLDRPVLTQDANLNEQKKWLFTKYDILGRVAYTGYIDNESSQSVLQEVANHPTTYTQWEKREPKQTYGGTDIYYSKTAVPHGVTKVYTINYYDTYVDLPTNFTVPTTVYNQVITTNTKGLSTVNKTRVLGTDKWITTISHYDEKARPIYVYSKNDYLGTVDISESKLNDFTGVLLESRTTHIKSGKTIVTIDSFTYDHMNRLLSQKQCIGDETLTGCGDEANSTDLVLSEEMVLNTSKTIVDNNSITFKDEFHVKATVGKSASFSISEDNAELITSNTYDDLGQLISKKVGNKEASPLQTVDYKYNVRGWLKEINDDDIADNDLFNFTINYNNPTIIDAALFNGNISQTSWNTLSQDKSIKTYTYSYDALNRITGAIDNTERYNLGGYDDLKKLTNPIKYDKNGNIKTLLRKGHINIDADVFGTMDNLVYSYDSGNKLHSVTDTGFAPIGVKGQFQDKNTSGNDYTYDVNGNMISDANKGITNITYNHLNLPKRVTFNNSNQIEYSYDATGVKQIKTVKEKNGSNTISTQTAYAGNFIYHKLDNGGLLAPGSTAPVFKLEFFNHPEGYVSPLDADHLSKGFKYIYQYKDHLGNVRLSYTDNDNNGVIDASSEIVEESNYYPFGLKHKGYNNVVSSNGNSVAQKYKYNGKELNEELGLNMYDYGARHYDPALGRFVITDRLSEEFDFQTPYAYAVNNPIAFVDKNGDNPILAILGVLAGAAVETATQVAASYATGKTFGQAFHNLDYADIGIAAVEGGLAGLTNGASLLITNKVSDALQASVDINGRREVSTVLGGFNGGDPKDLVVAGAEFIAGKAVGKLGEGVGKFIKKEVNGASSNLVKKTKNLRKANNVVKNGNARSKADTPRNAFKEFSSAKNKALLVNKTGAKKIVNSKLVNSSAGKLKGVSQQISKNKSNEISKDLR